MNLLNGYNYTSPMPSSPQVSPEKNRRWLVWILVVLGFLGLFAIGGAGYGVWAVLTPLSLKDVHQTPFIITKGESLEKIASNLVKASLIRRKEFFVYYAYYKKEWQKLQAGEYALRRDMNIPEILAAFVEGKVVPDEIAITFPEGFSVRDMDALLVKNELLRLGVFRLVSGDWEGYLFPDTYRFNKDVSATTIRDVMLVNFKVKFTAQMRKDAELLLGRLRLYNDLARDCRDRGRLLEDSVCVGDAIVTMASLIEKEVRNMDDMKMVSGILWKRMTLGIPLQVDATIVYLTNKKNGEVLLEDLKIASPYNTYLNRGLPPAPIANAGLKALTAAIYPTESEYLYYLSKPTGETVFSKTLEEHNIAKAKFLK
ncbi:MAG: endolytic transglycosylase MltG [bacterium]|nr:endolytic transglycosylase MltG [bacterium]